jgi:hypothetical protein
MGWLMQQNTSQLRVLLQKPGCLRPLYSPASHVLLCVLQELLLNHSCRRQIKTGYALRLIDSHSGSPCSASFLNSSADAPSTQLSTATDGTCTGSSGQSWWRVVSSNMTVCSAVLPWLCGCCSCRMMLCAFPVVASAQQAKLQPLAMAHTKVSGLCLSA